MSRLWLSQKGVSDGIWSLVGSVGSAVIGLATVRIVATWVDSASYGRASLLLGVVSLVSGMVVGPTLVVHLRLYFEYLNRGLTRWYSRTATTAFAVASCAAASLYLAIAFGYWWTGEALYLNYAVVAILVLVVQPFLSIETNYLEAHRNQRLLAASSLANRALYPLFALCLLAIQTDPASALVAAQGMATICVLVAVRRASRPHLPSAGPVQEWAEYHRLVRSASEFGWTLPAGYVAMWLITTSDRFLLQHFMTDKDVGLYVMNYGLWSMPYVLLNAWLELMTRPVVYAAAASANWRRARALVWQRAIFGTGIAIIGSGILYLVSETIGRMLIGHDYWAGRELVMVLSAAHCFYVLGYAIVPLFLAAKRTGWVLFATVLGGLVGIVSNLIAIPSWGLIGAASATLLSYVVWAAALLAAAGTSLPRLARA